MSDYTAPREQYIEYLETLSETGDLDTAMTYESWLEEELEEIWDEHGSSYF